MQLECGVHSIEEIVQQLAYLFRVDVLVVVEVGLLTCWCYVEIEMWH